MILQIPIERGRDCREYRKQASILSVRKRLISIVNERRNMKSTKTLLLTVALTAIVINQPSSIKAESVIEKSSALREELTRVIRELRPMVYNFPCEPFPECKMQVPEAERKKGPWERTKKFTEAKKIFQEGLIYHFEGDYINSYNRFLDTQLRVDQLLEQLSQAYIDRTGQMLRDSIERKYPESEYDKSVADITMDYGQGSNFRRDFRKTREAGFEDREYNPKMVHFVLDKYQIEANMKMGYYYLGLAKGARVKALRIEERMPEHRHIEPAQRSERVHLYLITIQLARRAKFNAEMIYHLKYPYENYALTNPYGKNEVGTNRPDAGKYASIEGVAMKWSQHPKVLPKNLNPVFDLSVPDQYRVDLVDIRDGKYDDDIDTYLKFKHMKKPPDIIVSSSSGGGNSPGAGGGN